MKIARLFSSIFALALCVPVLTSTSFTQNLPLNTPWGLAVDALGNLYVANSGGGTQGNILIYNSGYVQQTDKTITQGINQAEGVAIDPYGNLWVSNVFGNNITEYVNGVQNASATISTGISEPIAIAIDGLDNLWVSNNDLGSINIYSPTAVYAPPSNLVTTITPGINVYGIALGAGAFVFSSLSTIPLNSASATLLGSALDGPAYSLGASALAPDNSGNVYFSAWNGTVYVAPPNLNGAPPFATPPQGKDWQGIFGMAVDNAHKRVYMSDGGDNKIFVYSTAAGPTYGKLIHTIK